MIQQYNLAVNYTRPVSPWSGVAGKRVVLTGATSGIGLAAARRLAALGAELTLVARSPRRAAHALQLINETPHPDVLYADLASQADVRRLADEILQRYSSIEVLINNAGAMYTSRQLSPDGIELTWAVNYLAPFRLTTLLLERLKASAPARVIITTSAAHYREHIQFDDLQAERGYPLMGFARYAETKLADVLFTAELARRLTGTGVTANCFHPGFVGSGFNHNNGLPWRLAMLISRPFARTTERGAETLVWLADSAEVSDISGGYFIDKRLRRPSAVAQDVEVARRLWQVTEQQLRQPNPAP
jgi:NAD(P)-dependent dehydrogenase (short-subunit alcohol dehydrogenase family)